MLAVHGLNLNPDDPFPDFLLIPEIEGIHRVKTFLNTPTPSGTNSAGALLEKVSFSPVRGFFDNPFQVT